MRNKGCASWDRGKGTWGSRESSFGTIPVLAGVQEGGLDTLIITHQGNSQVKNCKSDLLTQEYEKFSISNEETIDSGFKRFDVIVTSLKSLYLDYYSKNQVRKYLCDLPLKWRANVMAIEEAKDLDTLPLDELVGNLKVYEMILENDGVVFKTTTKEKFKSLALKAKVTREQTSDNSDSQGGSDEDIYDSGVAIDMVMVPIGLEEVAKTAVGTKMVKAQDKKEFATIAV
nr:UBN2 domain-containing protein [Tanacetum cinerariifolium]